MAEASHVVLKCSMLLTSAHLFPFCPKAFEKNDRLFFSELGLLPNVPHMLSLNLDFLSQEKAEGCSQGVFRRPSRSG